MKRVIFITVMVLGFVVQGWGQEADPCNKRTAMQNQTEVKKVVEAYVKNQKSSSSLSEKAKERMKEKYTELQQGYNKIYNDIKTDIAKGYLFVGERRLCKTKYYSKLEILEEKTNEFLLRNWEVTEVQKSIPEWIAKVISGLIWLEEFAGEQAQKKADRFYAKVAWKNYDEI